MIKTKPIILAILLITALITTTLITSPITTAALPYTETNGILSGANYTIRIPNPIENWNGMLVMLCRGYTLSADLTTGAPITVLPAALPATGSISSIAPQLIAQGYAIAASNYGAVGMSIQKGINATYDLTQYVIKNFNVRGKVFLIGQSMGGDIALLLGQKYPNVFSGVLDEAGIKNLTEIYTVALSMAATQNDSALIALLQSINAVVVPYPISAAIPPSLPLSIQLQIWRNFSRQGSLDTVTEAGGTPTAVPQAYAMDSPIINANISIPVITIHGTRDGLVSYSQSLGYQAAVAAAGKSNLYRLYTVEGAEHVDSQVIAQTIPRFAELVSWSNALDAWTTTVADRSLKAYPDLKETIWQKNATMPPNGQYDKIGLHRLVKTGTTTKGAVFLLAGIYGSGEQLISNPTQSNYSIDESSNTAVYWANRGFDVYSIDYRAHFLPSTMNASEASAIMVNWGWDVCISDMKEAVEKAKAVSGFTKIFMAGMSYGETVTMYYASEYWRQDLKGLILLDGSGDTAKFTNTTNTNNVTSTLNRFNATGGLALEYPRTPGPSPYPSGILFAYQNTVQNPGAPAEWPPGTPLQPTINPLTNKMWTNISEWFAYQWYSSNYCNVYGGYGNLTANIQRSAGADRYFPFRLLIETGAIHDWNNCPFVAYDFDDHFKDINVPVLGFKSALYGIPTWGNYTNGLATTDFTQITLPNYMHLDVFTGTYSARDVSDPIYQWMIKRALTPILPAGNVTLTVVNGTSSYYNSTLTNVPFGYSLQNGNYAGWCVDKSTVMVRNEAHNVTLYSSLISNTLPSSINNFNWNAVNYILNHKQGSMQQIQDAIWYFVPDQISPPTNEINAIAMINAALANPNYMPTSGNILGIIAYSGSLSGVQNTIIEYRIP